jgi:hypothetical protein
VLVVLVVEEVGAAEAGVEGAAGAGVSLAFAGSLASAGFDSAADSEAESELFEA